MTDEAISSAEIDARRYKFYGCELGRDDAISAAMGCFRGPSVYLHTEALLRLGLFHICGWRLELAVACLRASPSKTDSGGRTRYTSGRVLMQLVRMHGSSRSCRASVAP